jgi:hypothetical protein
MTQKRRSWLIVGRHSFKLPHEKRQLMESPFSLLTRGQWATGGAAQTYLSWRGVPSSKGRLMLRRSR